MRGVNLSDDRQSVELSYSGNGTVRALARAVPPLESGRLYKIVYTPEGFAAVDVDEEPPEYFVGYATGNTVAGKLTYLLVGGLTDVIVMPEGTIAGMTVAFDDGMLRLTEKPYADSRDFAIVAEMLNERQARLVMLPRRVIT